MYTYYVPGLHESQDEHDDDDCVDFDDDVDARTASEERQSAGWAPQAARGARCGADYASEAATLGPTTSPT